MALWSKKIALVILIALTFLGVNSQAFAESAQPLNDKDLETSFKEMDDLASTTDEVTSVDKIQDIKQRAKNNISNGSVFLNNSNAKLDYDNSKVLDIKQNGKVYTSITLPIKGEKYSFTSNLTVIFNSQNEITNYSESLITKSDNNKFNITNYDDGKLTQNEETALDYMNDNELKKATTDDIQTKGVGKIASCIGAVAGVNAGVAYLIAGTCAASCPAVPPVCAACIGGVATMGAADIAGIIGCFQL